MTKQNFVWALTFAQGGSNIKIWINFIKQEKNKKKRGARKNEKDCKRCGCTHTHTSKFIKKLKGENAFIGDEIKGRLNL